MMTETPDDDFVLYTKNNKPKKDCVSWKACCLASTVTWFLTTLSFVTTIGILVAKEYIYIDVQNPNASGNYTDIDY
jgi:hypothetical protein